MNLKQTLSYLILFLAITVSAQHTDGNLFGDVQSNGVHVPFVNIYIEGTTIGTSTDKTGHYMLIDLPVGEHVVVAKMIGFKTVKKNISIVAGETHELNFVLEEESMQMNEYVVTGTKTFKRQTESAIIVNVLERKSLDMVQACNISEGLKFQPGLRVETDCQTCNYTQLRMNGLGGGYSQILINGRPVFSPLTGLYGMEQIPANMIDRIEVVRGGGSALYGSGAIGGTVNIITTIPKTSEYSVSQTTHNINGGATDNVFSGNINVVNQKRNAGAAIFVNRRHREAYDHPGYDYINGVRSTETTKDGYSELPELRNNSFGVNMFFKPNVNQKIEATFTSLYEYRFGGQVGQPAAYLTQQSEERLHNVLMYGLDYQINFNEDNSSFIAYFAGQNTDRDHYTGIMPEPEDVGYDAHFIDPPYGYTTNSTYQGGLQVNHRLSDFFGGQNVVTLGTEYVYDNVFDTIPSYNYEIDQITHNYAAFVQSDWEIIRPLNLLLGMRFDKHNLVDHVIASPRASLLYKHKSNTQLRLTWGTGFRAPQAFDTDMHIAFAGGGVSRIQLADDLNEERSQSLSASINYDKPTERFVAGFTLEGFYTHLYEAFTQVPIGSDVYGELFEKQNSTGATVQGATLELRANYNRKAQIEAGYTYQQSLFEEAQENIEGLEAKREFLRTPDHYGYATLAFTPNEQLNVSLSSIYTGTMLLAKFSPDPALADTYVESRAFTELNIKAAYTFNLKKIDTGLELFGGIKNITNQYQNDFDNGKYRDSNYVYGPAQPRTFYVGIKLKSL